MPTPKKNAGFALADSYYCWADWKWAQLSKELCSVGTVCSPGIWVNLPFSIINECALYGLYFVINWIYLAGKCIGFIE